MNKHDLLPLEQSKSFLTNKYAVICIAIFCSVLWGSAFPVLKVTYQELALTPGDYGARIILAAFRFMLAGLVLLIGVRFGLGKSLKLERSLWPPVISLGVLQIFLQYFFFYNGLAQTSGMKGAILQSCNIFFVVVLAHFIYQNDRLNWQKVFGLVAGFAGIIVVNWGQEVSWDFSLTGEGFLILAGLTSAVATILAKRLTQDVNAFLLTGWQMVSGSLLLFAVGFWDRGSLFLAFTPLALGLLVYSVFLSATAFSLWYAILKYNKAGEIAVYRFMIPVSGALLSSLYVAGENLNMTVILALLLVTAGIMVVSYHKS
jgi:drug/metabolite transporter (DMT)-like permease